MEETKEDVPLKEIKWGPENEKILKCWSDHGQCYQIMHDRAYKRYYSLNVWFSIPVIIISTITGTGNFAQSTIKEEMRANFILAIGAANLISAIIISIGQFLRVAQESEAHLRSRFDWDKYSRKIKIELSKVRDDRLDCNTFLTSCQEEYDKLTGGSPNIPTDVIRWFKELIQNSSQNNIDGCHLCIYECFCFPFGIECCNKTCTNTECENEGVKKYKNLDIPEIVGGIKPTNINTNNGNEDNEFSVYYDDRL